MPRKITQYTLEHPGHEHHQDLVDCGFFSDEDLALEALTVVMGWEASHVSEIFTIDEERAGFSVYRSVEDMYANAEHEPNPAAPRIVQRNVLV